MVCATFQQENEELAGGSIMFYTSFYEANSIWTGTVYSV